MKIINVGSGSAGNATFIYDERTLILIDCGIGVKRLSVALATLGKTLDEVDAVFFTHVHSDHTSNCALFEPSRCFSHPEFKAVMDLADDHLLFPYQTYVCKTLSITPLLLSHDAYCYGYLVNSAQSEESFVNITDTGYIPEKNFSYIKDATYYLFESNHDTQMLLDSNRPACLVRRIMSNTGHLNNYDSSYYLSLLTGDRTKAVMFAHISRDCNTGALVKKAFEEVYLAQKGALPSFETYYLRQEVPTFVGTLVKR